MLGWIKNMFSKPNLYEELYRAANEELDQYQVGEYLLIVKYDDCYGSDKCYMPKGSSWSEVFTKDSSQYADYEYERQKRMLSSNEVSMWLCKVVEVTKSGVFDREHPPRFVVENVVTHKTIDLAQVVEGFMSVNVSKGAYNDYQEFSRPVIPYLLTVKLNEIRHKPTGPSGFVIRRISNEDAEAHLKHIIQKKAELELKAAAAKEEPVRQVSESELDELYNQI